MDSKLEYLTNKEKTHKAASIVVNRKTAGVSDTNYTDVLLEISKETMDKGKDQQMENSLLQEQVPPNQPVSLFQRENDQEQSRNSSSSSQL